VHLEEVIARIKGRPSSEGSVREGIDEVVELFEYFLVVANMEMSWTYKIRAGHTELYSRELRLMMYSELVRDREKLALSSFYRIANDFLRVSAYLRQSSQKDGRG